jgi:hypothetical protein
MGSSSSAAQAGFDASDWQVKTGAAGVSAGAKYALIAGGLVAAVWLFARWRGK